MNRSGLVISLDGMLALSVTLILFIAAAFYLAGVESTATASVFLKEFSMDVATVLEKSEMLEKAVKRDSITEVRSFLNKMPDSLCLEVNIFEESDLDNAEITVLRSGCTAEYEEKTAIKRGFSVDGSAFYLAEVGAWYKVSS